MRVLTEKGLTIQPWQLAQRQSLPLEAKVVFSTRRIQDYYDRNEGQVFVSFSGGKDSTALLHLVRESYPEVPAVFVDTGLEFPEIRRFVRTIENVIWLRPEMNFKKVIETYGYPVASKRIAKGIRLLRTNRCGDGGRRLLLEGVTSDGHQAKRWMIPKKWLPLLNAPFMVSEKCCAVMKERPLQKFATKTKRHPIMGVMASDSRARRRNYLQTGCNTYESVISSRPLAIWLEDDVWGYIRTRGLHYSSVYDLGYDRTGCIFCLFGVEMDGCPNRFQRMKKTHPRHYDYCMRKLGISKVLDYIGVEYGDEVE